MREIAPKVPLSLVEPSPSGLDQTFGSVPELTAITGLHMRGVLRDDVPERRLDLCLYVKPSESLTLQGVDSQWKSSGELEGEVDDAS
jgi:hypothetical protein